jgi:glutathione S-transferase
MLKIWGRANSINVQKVLWCCGELGLRYERIDAGNEFGLTKTPEYRALNPNALVPTIEDGDFQLWESKCHRSLPRTKEPGWLPLPGRHHNSV